MYLPTILSILHHKLGIRDTPQPIQQPTPEPDEPMVSIPVRSRKAIVAHLEDCVTLQDEVAEVWERMEEMKERLEEILSEFPTTSE